MGRVRMMACVMARSASVSSVASVASVALVACSSMGTLLLGCDGDESRRPRYSTGATPDAQVSTLDDNQLRAACESYTLYVDTYVDFEAISYVACLPGALVTSFDTQSCETSLQNCRSLFPAPIRIQASAEVAVDRCVDELRGCRASVSQFEDCVNGNVDLAVGDYTCQGAGDNGYLQQATGLVSVCATIDDVCDRFEAEGPQ